MQDITGFLGRGRDDTSQSATREGASVGVAFKDNKVERQRRVVARRSGRTGSNVIDLVQDLL